MLKAFFLSVILFSFCLFADEDEIEITSSVNKGHPENWGTSFFTDEEENEDEEKDAKKETDKKDEKEIKKEGKKNLKKVKVKKENVKKENNLKAEKPEKFAENKSETETLEKNTKKPEEKKLEKKADKKNMEKPEQKLPEKEPDIKESYKYSFIKTDTEKFAFSMGYGTYGLTTRLSIFTLRWRRVFWETVKINTAFNLNYDAWEVFSVKLGTAVGVPFFITDDNRHEIRLSGGLGLGLERYKDEFSFAHGEIELSYVFHIHDKLAFQIGSAAEFPFFTSDLGLVSKSDSSSYGPFDVDYKVTYMPNIYGYIGFRF